MEHKNYTHTLYHHSNILVTPKRSHINATALHLAQPYLIQNKPHGHAPSIAKPGRSHTCSGHTLWSHLVIPLSRPLYHLGRSFPSDATALISSPSHLHPHPRAPSPSSLICPLLFPLPLSPHLLSLPLSASLSSCPSAPSPVWSPPRLTKGPVSCQLMSTICQTALAAARPSLIPGRASILFDEYFDNDEL